MPSLAFRNKNLTRASGLAKAVAERDGATIEEFVASLRLLPVDDAMEVLSVAAATMPMRDRIYWEGVLHVADALEYPL